MFLDGALADLIFLLYWTVLLKSSKVFQHQVPTDFGEKLVPKID